MSNVESILMKRDGLTKEEARDQKNYARELMLDAIESGDFDEVEDIMYSELGLEMDYIDELLI